MSEGETNDLIARIAEESSSLPVKKQSAVLDFVLSMKQDAATSSPTDEDGDAAWESIIADPRPRPKLEAFMKTAAEEGDDPLDLDRM